MAGPVTQDDARCAEVIFRCRKLAQDIAAHEREHIATASVQRHVEEAFAVLCGQFRALPDRYGQEMAVEIRCDAAKVHVALTKVIGQFLAGLTPPTFPQK